KLMLAPNVRDEDRARFLAEAESAAALKHPSIVPVHDVGIIDGSAYFSMDFIEGKNLRDLMDERFSELRMLLGILVRVCDAVGYPPRRGIIHRDLKPQNVMVDDEMCPHVMDFGLALRVESPGGSGARVSQRVTGAVEGTPVYMPPEQATGRTDLV